MSNLWWLEPGWKSAVCHCGANIWDSGGDPDHGVCWPCFFAAHDQEQEAQEELRRLENEEMERHYEKHPHG